MPLSHVGGLMVLVRSAAAAGTVVLEPPPFDAERVARAAARGRHHARLARARRCCARILDAGGRPGPRLRRVLLGGGPVPPGCCGARSRPASPSPRPTGSPRPARRSRWPSRATSRRAGRPLPGLGVSIAADGEIFVSGPTVVGEWDTLRTGDLGRLDDEGRLTVIGRKSDTIVTGGENVAPAEVEAVLEEHPAGRRGRRLRPRPTRSGARRSPRRVVPRGERRADRRRRCARTAPSGSRGYKVPKAFELADAAAAHRLWQAAAARADMTRARRLPQGEPRPLGRAGALAGARRPSGWPRATMPVSVWMVDALDLQPGHEVLELAAGTGEVGFLAAEQIEPGGTLISSDFVPEMITVAQARAERLGITNVRFRQIDAESIDQPAASLDGVLCRWGYMLMADGEAALRETRRVLRPGARVALAAWTGADREPVGVAPDAASWSAAATSSAPDPDAPGQFAWAAHGIIEERLDGAGFGEHEVDVVDFVTPSPRSTTGSTPSATSDAASATRSTASTRPSATTCSRRCASRRCRTCQEDGSIALPARTWVAGRERAALVQ